MRVPFKSLSRQASRTNRVTILALGVVLLVLGACGIWYWKYVETQTLLIQERNFRALTVTSHALREMVTNYESVFKSVIAGQPPPCTDNPCHEKDRRTFYEKALLALHASEGRFEERQVFKEVKVTKEDYENEGFAVKFIYQNSVPSIKLTYVHLDRAWPIQGRWKVTAVSDIGPIMRQLVTEDIFSDVLLANPTGRILYHHQSTHDPSGFEFEDASTLLHRLNGSESKEGGGEKGGDGRSENLVSTLPLFNEVSIGGVAHAIFAQATDLPADRGIAQTVILVGIVPAGQFHAEARAIPLNHLLLVAGLLLTIFFVLPYVKLCTNVPTERLTPVSVAVLIISSLLGTAVLTFGLADFATYRNLEQHLDMRLKVVSEEIRKRFEANVEHVLQQLDAFDESCNSELDCQRRLRNEPIEPHLAQRLCIAADEGGNEKGFSFFSTASDTCSEEQSKNGETKVVLPDVNTIFWVGSRGELRILRSREPDPWKYVNLKERQYVRRIWDDETFIRGQNGRKFWIQPIYSWTTGNNSAVLSMKSRASSEGRNPDRLIVAALEVKLPSVTDVGVPPGMGFAVIDQEGKVLFHSDSRRNLRENLFEETDRDGRLRQAVFARATSQFDGRYWGKDRHFYIAPLFPEEITESPDVHWSLVTYWDTDMLRVLNLCALYSSGALFFIYAIIALSIGIIGWWIYPNVNEAAYRGMWSQSEHLHHHRFAIGLLVVSFGAVGIWYVRPHSYPELLLWGLLPALVSMAVVLSIAQTKADHIDQNKTDMSPRRRYSWSYALVVTMVLLAFVVIPALVIFRVAVEVEWRLLAKFSQFDLVRDRALQAQRVREFHRPTSFHETNHNDAVQKKLFREFSNLEYVYANFPFESSWREDENRDSSSNIVVLRGDERLIRWLYHIIDRPRVGQSGAESDMFLEAAEQWQESEWGTLRLEDKSQGATSSIGLQSQIPPPVPQWLYSLLVFGGLVPLMALRREKISVFATVVGVLGGFLWFGLVGQAVAVLGVSVLLYGAYHVLPKFAAQRILLLDVPRPSMDSTDHTPPDGWLPGLWDVFVKEMSGLRNALRLTEIPWSEELSKSCEKVLKQDIEDDLDVGKERIIRDFLEEATNQYLQMWKKCTESQRRTLFNLARDGFLYTRNPDIGLLLKNGLVVGGLNLRPMNESFRRFVIIMGLKERLDEDIAQARTSAWWRPIGVGLLMVMIFLVLTQEQYRAITLAFLGVLPGLLGALSQALTSPKGGKLETTSSA